MTENFTTKQLFRIYKANLLYDANHQIQNCILFLNEEYRGLGKTTCINELSLNLMSDGYKILTVGHKGVEYYCDKFESVLSFNANRMRGLSRDYIILVDEITFKQQDILFKTFPLNRIYGFGRNY